jgi:hypothetical protein
VLVIKKIATVLIVLSVGLVGFGYLPKPVADRLTRALLVLMIVGFAIRVGAYLLQP